MTLAGYTNCDKNQCVVPSCPPNPACACYRPPDKPKLKITKSAKGVPGDGNELSYTITVTNIGGAEAVGYKITDTLAVYTTFLRSSTGSCKRTGQTGQDPEQEIVTCTSDRVLMPNQSEAISIVVRVLPGLLPDSKLTNTACVDNPATGADECAPLSVGCYEPCLADANCPIFDKNGRITGNWSCQDGDGDGRKECVNPGCPANSNCKCLPDISMVKTAPAEVPATKPFAYTVTATNQGFGMAAAGSYKVWDDLPVKNGQLLVEYLGFQPSTANCTDPERLSGSRVSCYPQTELGPGASFGFDIIVQAVPGLKRGETLPNTACVDNPATAEPECDTVEPPINLPPICGDGTASCTITRPHVLEVDLDHRTSRVTGFATDPENKFLTFSNWTLGADESEQCPLSQVAENPGSEFGTITPTGPQTAVYEAPPGDSWFGSLPLQPTIGFNVSDGLNDPIFCSGDVILGECACLADNSCVITEEEALFCGVDECETCEKAVYTVIKNVDPETEDEYECMRVTRCEFQATCGPSCVGGPIASPWFQTIGGNVHSNFPYRSNVVYSVESNVPAAAANAGFSLSLAEALEATTGGMMVGGGGEGIEICHIPPGHPENAHTITIPPAALAAHQAHGDSLGSCPGEGGVLAAFTGSTYLDAGVISGSLAPMSFGAGDVVSSHGWRIDAYPAKLYVGLGTARPLDYAAFWEMYADVPKTEITTGSLTAEQANGGVYERVGELDINSGFSVGSNDEVVIFVTGGNLNVNARVTVASGGFLAFITDRSVIISSELGGGLNDPDVQGVFIANGQIITQSAGENADTQLFAAGTFVSYGGFGLYRDLADDTGPAEVFIYRPDLILNTPRALRAEEMVYRIDPH